MTFTIAMNDRLAGKFQELYADQVARAGHPEMFTEPVVRFQWGLVTQLYLTADGRLLRDHDQGDSDLSVTPPMPIDMAEDYWLALVILSYWLDEPALLDLLPARPAGVPVCALCDGNHWFITKDGGRLTCPNCHALGWNRPHTPKTPPDS